MPALKNHKHEWFAQELAKGKTQIEAYELAGYKPDDAHASRLASDGRIQARVAEIQGRFLARTENAIERAAIQTEVTLASLMREAGEIQAAAMKERQLSAASTALTIKAKLAGLWVDKSENTNRNVDPDRLTDAELAAVIQADSGEETAVQAPDSSQLN